MKNSIKSLMVATLGIMMFHSGSLTAQVYDDVYDSGYKKKQKSNIEATSQPAVETTVTSEEEVINSTITPATNSEERSQNYYESDGAEESSTMSYSERINRFHRQGQNQNNRGWDDNGYSNNDWGNNYWNNGWGNSWYGGNAWGYNPGYSSTVVISFGNASYNSWWNPFCWGSYNNVYQYHIYN